MNESKGRIDLTLAQVFLSDHKDSYTGKFGADVRSLCGHGDAMAEGDPQWDVHPFEPMGAVEGKVIDTRLAQAMSFDARIGHPCGENFNAAKFLAAHPEYSWQASVLTDMNAGPWTEFRSGEHAPAR
jgi:hypothetical protein